jgi:hypothetical protein
MLSRSRVIVAAAVAAAVAVGGARAASLTDSLKKGTPELKSAGALAFAPEGILLVGDSLGAAVYAIDTGDRPSQPATGALKVDGVNEKIAGLLGADTKQVTLNGLAVNPLSGNAYLSATRGQGPDAQPVLIRVRRSGEIQDLPLKDVKFAKAELPNAPAAGARDRRGTPLRLDAITSLAYADGRVFVAGLSNEEFASKLRAIPFPFGETDRGTSVEIYHASHRHLETGSPVRTFVPYKIGDETNLLAAYTCTPLVQIPVSKLQPGSKVTGKTIAELGNMNKPLDMIVYKDKEGKDYILMANSARGVMKIPTEGIDKAAEVKPETKLNREGKAGLSYETIKDLKGVVHLAKLDDGHALVLIQKEGALNLDTIELQ